MRTSLHFPPLAGVLGPAALALFLGAGGCGPEYPNCDNDEDCHEGEFCVNGLCQQCRDDGDCPTGQRCAEGRCDPITGFCQSDTDCPGGQECQNNQCVEAATAMTDLPAETGDEGPCSLQPVYFDFDSADLQGGARDSTQTNAQCINERSISKVHLTGHCDPRGTEEYNLALGERRARAVKGYLTSLGVNSNSISVSSMGEEMARGTDESSWRQDRRVEFTER